MGFFGTYLFDAGRWSGSDDTRVASEPWLFLNIYEGDIATVMYRPCAPATGMAFLGFTPRSYFADGRASPPTDVELEARGLAAWWSRMHGITSESERLAKEAEVRGYLAPDTDPYDVGGAGLPDPETSDTMDLVEVKAARFLTALGLPLPDDLDAALGS